jgi:hypothetical protein
MAHDAAEMKHIARVPPGREAVTLQLFRLLQAYELLIDASRAAARVAPVDGYHGTNPLLVSEVLRANAAPPAKQRIFRGVQTLWSECV